MARTTTQALFPCMYSCTIKPANGRISPSCERRLRSGHAGLYRAQEHLFLIDFKADFEPIDARWSLVSQVDPVLFGCDERAVTVQEPCNRVAIITGMVREGDAIRRLQSDQ